MLFRFRCMRVLFAWQGQVGGLIRLTRCRFECRVYHLDLLPIALGFQNFSDRNDTIVSLCKVENAEEGSSERSCLVCNLVLGRGISSAGRLVVS